jgi:hypothetical protein
VWSDTRGQVEKVWADAFAQLNSRFQEAEKDAREFVKKVEIDGRKRLEQLLETLKVTGDQGLIHLIKTNKLSEDLVETGHKVREEVEERIALVNGAAIAEIKAQLTAIGEQLTALETKVGGRATTKAVADLKQRIDKLEKAAKK